jgi:hypothetical protein
MCSLQNPKDLHLEFVSGDDGNMTATFWGVEAFEGYPVIFHVVIVSPILDGAMGHCVLTHGQTAVTAEATTRFRHPNFNKERSSHFNTNYASVFIRGQDFPEWEMQNYS